MPATSFCKFFQFEIIPFLDAEGLTLFKTLLSAKQYFFSLNLKGTSLGENAAAGSSREALSTDGHACNSHALRVQ